MTDGATRQLIGIAIPTLKHLRLTTLGCISAGDSGDADAVDALREAGFAGGPAVYAAFEQWLNENEAGSAENLSIEEFGDRAAKYFRDAGWGLVEFDATSEQGVAVLSMSECWEADAKGEETQPECHITTGMLASFFGQLAGYPVAVMETECRSAGGESCRFLLGNSEMMAYRWEQIQDR
ncbi:MAG TPA: V4R domain-containing protein [Gemmatimonadaceae bacterium]|jgi:predicted hydrocarbon binding protein|nr:V4R domain-containing protein [Gemmatimonadaceae bacterium]